MAWLSNNWDALSILLLLVIAFVIFTFFQATPSFADPDSFYHIKMAQLIPKEGVIKTFPWLQFTILKNSYIDQHFLYHVYLIPFVYLMDPIEGAKLATVILGAAITLIFYFFLRSEKVKFSFVLTLVLLASMPFMFRINLIKAPVFAIILLLLGLYFLFRNKPVALLVLSFFYVWAYGGFILILVFSGVYALVSLAVDFATRQKYHRLGNLVRRNKELKLFVSSLAGVILGVIINIQFPQNLIFYWHQLVKIGIINYQKVISVGNEWYPYKFTELTAGTAIISVLILISLYLVAVNYRKPSKKVITTFLIYIFFLAFTLKSRRYVEYYVPFALIFAAFALNYYLWNFDWRKLWSKFYTYYFSHRIIVTVLVVYFLTTVPTLIIKDGRGTYNDLKNGISTTRFAKVSAWLEANSNPGDIVFHSSWDEFPMLFYFNSKDYYIFGLDPTFSYEFSHEFHQKIVAITTGSQADNLQEDIKNTFHASFVFVEKNHAAMNNNIVAAGFKQVYADNEATVYKVP